MSDEVAVAIVPLERKLETQRRHLSRSSVPAQLQLRVQFLSVYATVLCN